jgi:hypothetical protein
MEPERQAHGIACYQIKSHMECGGPLLFCVLWLGNYRGLNSGTMIDGHAKGL